MPEAQDRTITRSVLAEYEVTMRLTCPNCNAQYEVDERVIPEIGRDVQCSACAHTWYQHRTEVAFPLPDRQDAREEPTHDEDENEPADALSATSETNRAAAPRIDKSVLDVLREEAEHEMNERRRSQSDLETQGDLGLTRPSRPAAAPLQDRTPVERALRGSEVREAPQRAETEPDVETSRENADAPQMTPSQPAPALHDEDSDSETSTRRTMLPNIEELTSTLEPGRENRLISVDEGDAAAAPGQRGFRGGLSTVILIAIFVVAVYVFAPLISNYVPALDDVLTTYVGMVDGLRATVSSQLRSMMGG